MTVNNKNTNPAALREIPILVKWGMANWVITPRTALWNMSADWVIQGVGDFNGDGTDDILWRQHGTGKLAMWIMKAGTIQSSVAAFNGTNLSADWVIQEVADLDGDGKADILWRHSTGIVSIWLMDGATRRSAVGAWNVGLDSGIQTPTPPRVTLAWQYNSSSETGFRIERSPDGTTNWTEIGTTGANVTTYQDAGLAPWTTYYYRVRAYSSAGISPYSSPISVTTP